jgi:hypothetical protein
MIKARNKKTSAEHTFPNNIWDSMDDKVRQRFKLLSRTEDMQTDFTFSELQVPIFKPAEEVTGLPSIEKKPLKRRKRN